MSFITMRDVGQMGERDAGKITRNVFLSNGQHSCEKLRKQVYKAINKEKDLKLQRIRADKKLRGPLSQR